MAFSISFGIYGRKAKLVGGIILALLTIGFLVGCFCTLSSNLYVKNNYLETQAVVERVEVQTETWTDSDGEVETTRYYDVYVEYEVDGQEYGNLLYTNKGNSYAEGELVKIFYDPSNPNKIRDFGADFLLVFVFAGLSLVLGTIAVCLFVSYGKDKGGETYYSVRGRIRR